MQLMKRPKERKRLSMKKNYAKKKLKQNLRFVGLTFQFDVFLLNFLILVLSSLLYSCYSYRYPLKCMPSYLESSWIMSNLELLWRLPCLVLFGASFLHFMRTLSIKLHKTLLFHFFVRCILFTTISNWFSGHLVPFLVSLLL